jgi:hypothetical protein
MVDDSFIGIQKKVLEYINVKKTWNFYSDKSWYQVGDAKPIIIFEIQM